MSDFRIIISDIEDIEPATLAENIMAAHGDDFDASLGDFASVVDGNRVMVTVLKVAGGDVDALANDIAGQEDGTFVLRMQQREGSNWFAREEGDDEITTEAAS